MLSRHTRYSDRGLLARDTHEAVVKEVEIVYVGEGVFAGGGGSEVGFRVRGGDDGEVCWERGRGVSVG